MGTQDQGQPLANSYDFWFLDYSKVTCSKGCLEHLHISMYGLVHLHQNTKQIFVEFSVTKDTKTLKQHQQFFLECIDLISEDVNVKVMYIHVSVLFCNEVNGSNLTFSPLKSLCKLMASNKSWNNTVMKESVFVIVWWNDNSLELSKSTLTASQNIDCPYIVGFWQMFKSSIQLKPSWKDFDDRT